MLDDFCVEDDRWVTIGGRLVSEIMVCDKDKGSNQIIVVCGAHDGLKKHFLKDVGLSIVSEWYACGID